MPTVWIIKTGSQTRQVDGLVHFHAPESIFFSMDTDALALFLDLELAHKLLEKRF